MNALEHLVLVTENDVEMGTMEKMEVHEKGLLHRAFSVFIFNEKGEWLLHKRAAEKYHSPNLWTNACCSHPFPGEGVMEAAHRRLNEELGFDCAVQKAFHFTYNAAMENGLTEHEFDHVFTGVYDGPVLFNQSEVSECKFVPESQIEKWITDRPADFTAWFGIAFPLMQAHLKS